MNYALNKILKSLNKRTVADSESVSPWNLEKQIILVENQKICKT